MVKIQHTKDVRLKIGQENNKINNYHQLKPALKQNSQEANRMTANLPTTRNRPSLPKPAAPDDRAIVAAKQYIQMRILSEVNSRLDTFTNRELISLLRVIYDKKDLTTALPTVVSSINFVNSD